jgi:hypothetical protein
MCHSKRYPPAVHKPAERLSRTPPPLKGYAHVPGASQRFARQEEVCLSALRVGILGTHLFGGRLWRKCVLVPVHRDLAQRDSSGRTLDRLWSPDGHVLDAHLALFRSRGELSPASASYCNANLKNGLSWLAQLFQEAGPILVRIPYDQVIETAGKLPDES